MRRQRRLRYDQKKRHNLSLEQTKKQKQKQTDPETTQQVVISTHSTVSSPNVVFCSVVLNGVQLIQCNVPGAEDSITHAEVALKRDVLLYGESSGLFLQLMFYSPNFPADPAYHIHGMRANGNDEREED